MTPGIRERPSMGRIDSNALLRAIVLNRLQALKRLPALPPPSVATQMACTSSAESCWIDATEAPATQRNAVKPLDRCTVRTA